MYIKDEYRGRSFNRLNENPLEKAFAEEWQKECEKGLHEYILSSSPNNKREPVRPSVQLGANTIIQWLGSPVGQGFLLSILKRKESERFFEYILADPSLRARIKKMF